MLKLSFLVPIAKQIKQTKKFKLHKTRIQTKTGTSPNLSIKSVYISRPPPPALNVTIPRYYRDASIIFLDCQRYKTKKINRKVWLYNNLDGEKFNDLMT